MSEYLKTLCSGATLLSLALLFLPEKPALRRAALTVFSLILLLLLLPGGDTFSVTELFPDSESESVPLGDVYIETVAGAVNEGVRADLCSRFSLAAADVRIESDLTLTETALEGSYIHLYLGGENLGADAASLLRYVQNTYGLDCEVHFVWS